MTKVGWHKGANVRQKSEEEHAAEMKMRCIEQHYFTEKTKRRKAQLRRRGAP